MSILSQCVGRCSRYWPVAASKCSTFIPPRVFRAWDVAVASTGVSSRHLDSWLMTPDVCREAFAHSACKAELAIVEGVYASARPGPWQGGRLDELCDWLDLPRLVVLDASRIDGCCLPERPRKRTGCCSTAYETVATSRTCKPRSNRCGAFPCWGAWTACRRSAPRSPRCRRATPGAQLCQQLATGAEPLHPPRQARRTGGAAGVSRGATVRLPVLRTDRRQAHHGRSGLRRRVSLLFSRCLGIARNVRSVGRRFLAAAR